MSASFTLAKPETLDRLVALVASFMPRHRDRADGMTTAHPTVWPGC